MPRPKSGVWEHWETMERDNKKISKCVFCSKEYVFPNATRLTEHLITCVKCPYDIKTAFKKKQLRKKNAPYLTPTRIGEDSRLQERNNINSYQTESQSHSTSIHSQDLTNELHASIADSNISNLHEEIDAALARAAYATGMPLCSFENKYWQNALKLLKLDYKPPTKYEMSNALLDAEYYRIKNDMEKRLKEASSLCLVTDGWSNVRGKGVINFIITTPEPIFWSSIYPGTQRETGEYITEQAKKVLAEIGSDKFVAMVTDNASNMRAAWRQIQAEINHIDCIGCAAHGLNLLFTDIMKIPCFQLFFEQCKKIVKHINRRHVCLAVFEEIQKEKYGGQFTTLKLPSKTRWAGAIQTFKSLSDNREALESLAITQQGAHVDRSIKVIILSDSLWSTLMVMEAILSPISIAIANIESNKAHISEVPAAFLTIKKQISSLDFPDDCTEIANSMATILTHIENRKQFCVQPVHLATYMLDPRFHKAVFDGYQTLSDDEFLKMTQYITKLADNLNISTCDLMAEFAEYQAKEGFWANEIIWRPVMNITPLSWWKGLCSTKLLSNIAVRLLSIPPSSAAAERNWSLFGRTHTKDRNRLLPERLNKLIFIRANLHLQTDYTNHMEEEITEVCDESDSDLSD